MSDYYNDELRKRQADGDVGHAVLGNFNASGGHSTKRAFLLPLVMLGLGILLTYVGPVPGLGAFMVFGAVMLLPVVAIRTWLSP